MKRYDLNVCIPWDSRNPNLQGDWTELGQEDKALKLGLILSLAAPQGGPYPSHRVQSELHMAVEEEADAYSPLPLGFMRC